MYKVAVCDDEAVICSQFEGALASCIADRKIDLDVFYSGEELVRQLNEGQRFDLLFLDIELRLMNGVEAGRYIRNELGDEMMQIVYISAKQQYAMELFELRPLNFLVKPLSEEIIVKTLDKAMKLSGISSTCFSLKKGAEIIRIPYGSIDYIESDGRKIKVHTGEVVYDMYDKLNHIEEMLPDFFLRIHQSYIVNTMRVKRWKAAEACISETTVIPISRNYRKKVSTYLLRAEQEDSGCSSI